MVAVLPFLGKDAPPAFPAFVPSDFRPDKRLFIDFAATHIADNEEELWLYRMKKLRFLMNFAG